MAVRFALEECVKYSTREEKRAILSIERKHWDQKPRDKVPELKISLAYIHKSKDLLAIIANIIQITIHDFKFNTQLPIPYAYQSMGTFSGVLHSCGIRKVLTWSSLV